MKKVIKFFGVLSAVALVRLLPFNWIVGSSQAYFSWSSIGAPVIASQCGLGWIICFLLSAKLWTVSSLAIYFLHKLPLFCSAQLFVRPNQYVAVFLPLVCMGLFIIHPIGQGAWLYSLYWLIPVGLYIKSRNAVWARALMASFVSHAVGSIVWLYSGNIPTKVWLALIPVVLCERLLIAGAIVVSDQVCFVISRQFQQIYQVYVSCYRER